MQHITEYQTYDGEVLGQLIKLENGNLIFVDLDVEYPEPHEVMFITKYDDEILIHCYDGNAFRF